MVEAPWGIVLDHVGDEWFHKLEPFVFLGRESQDTYYLMTRGNFNLQVILPN